MNASSGKARGGGRFGPAALREAAGETVFARGEAYFRQGRVRLISVTPGSVRAQVTGSEVYEVTLEGEGARFDGDCDCPAFEDWDFCKHVVATALAVNAAAPAELQAAGEKGERIRAHLASLPHDTLAARLLALAERDEDLWRELEIEAALAGDDDETLAARLGEAIDAATDTGYGVDWRGAGTFAAELDAVLRQIGTLVGAGRAGVALEALDRFLGAAEEALAEVDDSNGEVYATLERAIDLHLAALAAATPDPVALAANLFERQLDSDYDLWDGAHDRYGDVLGEAGRAEFHRLARAAWEAAVGETEAPDRRRLGSILDSIAQSNGDIEARIALRVGYLANAYDYCELARLCLDAGREERARAFAEEGLWKCEDRPDERLTLLVADLRRRAGEHGKADGLLWAAFERAPSPALYRALRADAVKPEEVVDRAAAALSARMARADSRYSPYPEMLVQILMDERRGDQAWAAARAHNPGERMLEKLARATEDTHPQEALATYGELIERRVQAANNGAYAEACRLLARMEAVRLRLGRDMEQAAHVADLGQRHKAKRNFIRLLSDRKAWEAG